MVGVGIPSAVQLNDTFCPPFFSNVAPVLFRSFALTMKGKDYK